MNGAKRRRNGAANDMGYQVHPKVFVFFDRTTGTPRFEVKAGPDGRLPEEQALSMLAIQCVVRGRAPEDFRVMVATTENLLDGLAPRAKKLIQGCLASTMPIHLSARQREVLRAVLESLSNKEIAAKLHLSVRTVKFHVSSLFQKFNVQRRVDLMRQAASLLSQAEPPREVPSPLAIVNDKQSPGSERAPIQTRLLRLSGSERRLR